MADAGCALSDFGLDYRDLPLHLFQNLAGLGDSAADLTPGGGLGDGNDGTDRHTA